MNRTGVSILLVHHLRKMKSDDPFEEISGTTGIAGAVDGMYVMKKYKDTREEVTLTATGRDIESFDLKISFNKETHHWELIEKSLETQIEDECVVNVVKLFQALDSFEGTATELSQILKMELSYDVLPSVLSKKLRKNSYSLRENNIEFIYERTSYQKTIILRKIIGSTS